MDPNFLPALIGALVGGGITVAGWLVNYYLERRKVIQASQREAKIHYLQQQIEELYGPLWSLVEQSRIAYSVACRKLPLRPGGSFDNARFSAQDNAVFGFFNESYFLPINAQVAELLRKKVYLLRDGEMPESFVQFFDHQIMSESLFRLWKEKGVDSSDINGPGYPAQFGPDVKAALDDLRQEYYAEIAIKSKIKKRH
jgi:hypothetical protein